VAGPGSGAASINDLAGQRFNQMITNRVLGNVLLGINEQVNCNDCISAFGSAGSFSAGIHGRKNLTPNLSLLAGIAYAQYNEGGYRVTSSPIGAFALRYDFVDWGSSRPFFDVGAILSPFQKVRYTRGYATSRRRFTPADGGTDLADFSRHRRTGNGPAPPAGASPPHGGQQMKHDKTDRDLNKDVSMPGSSSSQGSDNDRLRRGNLEESEVGASSSKGDLGSSSGSSGRTSSSSTGTSSSSSSGSRTGSSDINR